MCKFLNSILLHIEIEMEPFVVCMLEDGTEMRNPFFPQSALSAFKTMRRKVYETPNKL